jgi:hypothetical protein
MRQTLLISVAALALAAGSTVAMSQGSPAAAPGEHGGAGAIGASPSPGPAGAGATTAPGGQNGQITETPAPGRAAQDRTIPEKKSSQQVPANGKQAPVQQGQAAPAAGERRDDNRQGANERHEGTKQGANERNEGTTKQGAAERPMNSRNVSLTTEQKTTIRKTVLTGSAPRVTGKIDFDVRVGVAVPRTVRFAPVPTTLITIEPEWRGYDYFVYADQIIIVNPRTFEIVAVLDV